MKTLRTFYALLLILLFIVLLAMALTNPANADVDLQSQLQKLEDDLAHLEAVVVVEISQSCYNEIGLRLLYGLEVQSVDDCVLQKLARAQELLNEMQEQQQQLPSSLDTS